MHRYRHTHAQNITSNFNWHLKLAYWLSFAPPARASRTLPRLASVTSARQGNFPTAPLTMLHPCSNCPRFSRAGGAAKRFFHTRSTHTALWQQGAPRPAALLQFARARDCLIGKGAHRVCAHCRQVFSRHNRLTIATSSNI